MSMRRQSQQAPQQPLVRKHGTVEARAHGLARRKPSCAIRPPRRWRVTSVLSRAARRNDQERALDVAAMCPARTA
jgi:hypothetical protein